MVTLLFWGAIIALSIAIEVHTNAFIGLFIGLGATLSLVLSLLGVPFAFQALAWLGFSGGTIWILRPFAMRRFHHHAYQIDMSRPTHTTMTDLRGVVEMTVGDERHPGKVKIRGESWKAVTDWPEAIPDGAQIVVRMAYGTTLWVEPA